MSDTPKRFSRDELEVACIDAFMSGRVYNKGGEKEEPDEAHRKMLNRAIAMVMVHRREERKRRRVG